MTVRFSSSRVIFCVAACLVSLAPVYAQWQAPTPEELSMTAQPQVPGATAVYLYREQMTDDKNRMFSFYVRLKVLSDGGKDMANVELPFIAGTGGASIDSISGRTIHPDGTIIPFTGKPYEKLTAKTQGFQEKAKVFTLPAVEVGSILEYRYKLHYDDRYFESPDWYVQSDLFMRKAHYVWHPTLETVGSSNGDVLDRIAYTQILPPGNKVEMRELPGSSGGREISLDIADVPPLPHEDMMPPVGSISYRVLFYYTQYKDAQEFWLKRGKEWAKAHDKFIGPGSGVKAFVAQTVSPSDTQEVKAKKLYDAVMTLENTDYTRQHSTQEDKAQGLKQVNSTDDILARKRGSSDQLSDLYVAMARAAGLKAYVLAVTDRSRRVFLQFYLSTSQFDDDLAIVAIDGKERVLDPGTRYCRFGQLAWQHTGTGGFRETDTGTALVAIPDSLYKNEHTIRIADLKLDDHGEATGTVTLTYDGNPALHWRQEALRGDDASLNTSLKSSLEHQLPGGMDIRVTDVQNLSDPDKSLIVKYEVKGAIGAPTGKRLLITGELFQSNEKAAFTATKRETPVAMHFPSYTQDAVRINYPASMMIESAPSPETSRYATSALYTTSVKEGTKTVTLFRNLELGKALFSVDDYPQLRTFYNKLESKDQEPLVLIRATAPVATPAAAPAGGGN